MPWLLMLCAAFINAVSALAAADTIACTPVFTRLDLPGGSVTTITLTVASPVAATILAAESDYRCLALTTPLPLAIPAGGSAMLLARVVAIQAGVEHLTLRTTAGVLRTEVHVVTNGLGHGRDLMTATLQSAATAHERVIVIVHDLHGHVRNCGCSDGSLGGIDHLAALPGWCATIAPTVPTTFLATGNVEDATPLRAAGLTDGSAPHPISAALARTGWATDDPHVRIADDPTPWLTAPDVIAIVTASCTLNHRRIVRPVANGGMTATVLRVNAQDLITEQVVVPIDRTLPSDPAVLADFPEHLTAAIVGTAAHLADACAPCHQTAAASWTHSRHAHAWESLKPADQVDGCVSCHSTPVPSASSPTAIAMGVACQACHQGTDAHLASGGTVKTTGATDCRSCHAPRHDPGFQRDKAWQVILHGK